MKFWIERQVGKLLFSLGFKPSSSHGIGGDHTMGYGELSDNGYWQFPVWEGDKKLFERFRKWLSGSFTCTSCGELNHLMIFGYGEAICPNCYAGEKQFIFLDKSYWLNRLLSRFIKEGVEEI